LDLTKDESGESEKKKYAPIVINENGNLISEPHTQQSYLMLTLLRQQKG
jgi:hypothetical protein